jgi:hypothetical protein
MQTRTFIAAAALAALAASPSFAQQAKTTGGLVINLGLMSAEQAVHADGHRDAHPAQFPGGSEHIVITLADEKTGRRIADADVVVEVVDPKGKVSSKPLLHTSAAGMPDYSELFVFGWSGKYTLRVTANLPNAAKPVKTSFTVNHSL